MDKHIYCCQNAAQNYFDHIIPVPDDFKVNPDCLCVLNSTDFIKGLKALTDTIKEMYSDMIQNPAEYGLPLVEDIEYSPFNPKAAESKNSSHRLIAILHTLAQCGELYGGKIVVNTKEFLEICKKTWAACKISNSNMIFKKLSDYGFKIDGFNGKNFDKKRDKFVISHTDCNVAPVLYGYMKNTPLKKHALFSLNYYLAISQEDLPVNNHQTIFTEYITGDEREFYIRLNESMDNEGLIVGNAPDYTDFSIEYLINSKDEKRIVRCHSNFGKLSVRLQLHNSGSYAEFIENLPERIKRMFRTESTCRFCRENCRMRLSRTFEGITFTDCGYGNYFNIVSYHPDDIEYYMQIILLEIKAAKTNARKQRP